MAISVHRVIPREKILLPGNVTCAIIMIVGSDTEKATNIWYTYVWEVSGRLGLKKSKSVYSAHRFLRMQFESGVATWSRTVGCTEPVGYDEMDSIGFHS